MLILGRKNDKSIDIGDEVKITVFTNDNKTTIGIEAPFDVSILRSEIEGGSDHENTTKKDFIIRYLTPDGEKTTLIKTNNQAKADKIALGFFLKSFEHLNPCSAMLHSEFCGGEND